MPRENREYVIESVSHFLLCQHLDKGIDDMESGNTLPLEESFEEISKLRNNRRNTEQE